MNRDSISLRLIGVLIVAVLGVTIVAAIGTPAAQATNHGPDIAQANGVADCSRCHDGAKGSGLNPEMCGECHEDQYESWQESGHAEALSEGESRSKIERTKECGSCHVESKIKTRTDISFQTEAIEAGSSTEPVTCEACHAPPERGWFYHFGKGGDVLEPAGVGPHGSQDANVSSAQEVCTACHSNDVVLQLANESKIGPHSTALVTSAGNSSQANATNTTDTASSPVESSVPGFGVVGALIALFGTTVLLRSRR